MKRFSNNALSFSRTLAQQRRCYTQPSSGVHSPHASAVQSSKALTSPYYNQSTSMPAQTRQALGLRGYHPPAVETLDHQQTRALQFLRAKTTALDKYIFLAQLRNSNLRLFYKLVNDQFEEVAPIIYTPTVGEACVEYSNIYPFLAPPGSPDGLYVTINDLPNLKEIIRSYCAKAGLDAPEITVISDGSRILGLGDLGVNGIGIPIGKLQLYVGAAGIDPRKTLPIILDFGTNNEKYLDDPLYLGLKQNRPNDEKFYASMDQVMSSIYEAFPDILVQFEDFQSDHAFGLLEKYQNKVLCFNDDIQGTGSVILSGFMNAIKLAEKKSGVLPQDHRFVFFGAGSSAIGVGKQLQAYFMNHYGLSEDQSKKMIYYVDSKGLITQDRGDKLAQHKVYFARNDNNEDQFKSLAQVLDYVKPTALIGLSAQGQAFTPDHLKQMATLNQHPIVFPLSNPMTNAECTFEQAMINTDERVIFASGTAFPSFVSKKTGQSVTAGQGNNMYIFPGLGLGCLCSKATRVSDGMIYAAAQGLANTLSPAELEQGHIYPALTRIREVSAKVAAAVTVQAVKEKLATEPRVLQLLGQPNPESAALEYVHEQMWDVNQDDHFITAAASS
ncbi:malic enzyme [Hesseltinella vesiculosa]|uniref:Malic enzyme n=1 Tax=Hesseltinella vesiculosa TaxID=101127 RepID=A0A1X2GV86_9FUNG|nr:malic enzyme [Hesseltinella vesiculosa]